MIRLTTAPILSEAVFAWTTTEWIFSCSSAGHPFRPPAEQVQGGDVDIDPGEGVPDLVGDPGGQMPEGGELLPCRHDLLEVFYSGDVDHVHENGGPPLEVDRNGTALHPAEQLLPRLNVADGEPELHPLPERHPIPYRCPKPPELRDVLRVGRPQSLKIELLRNRTQQTLLFRIPESDTAILDDHGADGRILHQGPEPVLAFLKQNDRQPPLLLHPDTLEELPLEPDVRDPKLFRPLGHAGLQLVPRNTDLLFAPFEIPEHQIVGAVQACRDDRLVDQVERDDIQVMAEKAAIHERARIEIVRQLGGDRKDNRDNEELEHLPVEMPADPP